MVPLYHSNFVELLIPSKVLTVYLSLLFWKQLVILILMVLLTSNVFAHSYWFKQDFGIALFQLYKSL